MQAQSLSRKILSVLMSIAMVMSLQIPALAFAAEDFVGGGEGNDEQVQVLTLAPKDLSSQTRDADAEPVAFSVYTQAFGSDEKVLAKEFTASELADMADDTQQAQQWAQGIAVTTSWVSLDDLFDATSLMPLV